MKLHEIKTLIKFLKDLNFETSDFKEVHLEMEAETEDFEVNDYRFIHKDSIDFIQRKELRNDLYLLGCFNSWFLSDCSGLPIELIEAGQKGEQFEAIGKAMLPYIDAIQEEYSRLDGYGHHFSPYDGNESEVLNYYVFRLN
jgi:hypothetical protein